MSESLEDVQDRVLDALHAGELPDREALLAAHPEHADALARFLDLLAEIETTPRAADRPPARLGEFRILREIGRGGMGVVYEAEQPSLRRRVALKVLPPALAHDPRVLARFRREAEAAGRLRHPNIVPVFSVGESGGVPFFAMELVEGRSLAEVIRERAAGGGSPMPPDAWRRWAAEIAARVADALHAAHAERILHRDVKPANVILDPSGTPRLTDFGLAADLAAPGLTMTGETFGTPLYMSPEQALRREAPLDPRTDVYSLGVTLYELLTLRSPYDATTTPEILSALQQGLLVAPRKLDPAFPEALERVVLRAMGRAPDDRYATAAAFAEDLRNWLAGRPVEAPAAGPPRSARPERAASHPTAHPQATRRVRLRVALAASVMALVFVGVLWLGPHEPREGLVLGGGPITAKELRALIDGTDPEGVATLHAWVDPQVRLRGVVARDELGSYRVDLGTGFTDPDPLPGVPALVIARFEAQAEGVPVRDLGFAYAVILDDGVILSRGPEVRLADVLGHAKQRASVVVTHRAKIRIVARPPTLLPSMPPSPEQLTRAWESAGGTACSWQETRTLLVFDEAPSGHPEFATGPDVDPGMLEVLSPTRFHDVHVSSRGESGGDRRISVMFDGMGAPGPVPAVFEVHLLDPDTGLVLARATWVRDARDEDREDEVRHAACLRFAIEDGGSGRDAGTLVGLANNSAETVTLRFVPSRRLAFETTDFEQIWGRELHLVVPSKGARDDGRRTEAKVVPYDPPKTLRLRDLAKEGAPGGVAAIGRMVTPRVGLRRVVSRRSPGSYEIAIVLDTGGVPVDGDTVFLALWEIRVDAGPWRPIEYVVCGVGPGGGSGVSGAMPLERSLGAALSSPSVEVLHRLTVKVAPRPQRLAAGFCGVESYVTPQPEWAEAAGPAWMWDSGPVTLLVYDDFPDDYPEAVRSDELDAQIRTSLAPTSGGACRIGPGRVLNAPFVFGASPVPLACEVDLVADDGSVVGTATYTQPSGDGPTARTVSLDFVLAEPAAAAEQRLLLDLAKGGAIQVKLRFRPSRDVARRLTAFDRYWNGTVTVPVSIGGM